MSEREVAFFLEFPNEEAAVVARTRIAKDFALPKDAFNVQTAPYFELAIMPPPIEETARDAFDAYLEANAKAFGATYSGYVE